MKKYLVLWENIAIGEVILDETTQIYKIAVHLIVTFVAGGDVRFRDARVHIDFVYAHTFCRYQ